MRLAFVVQRYGQDVAGGAELHCRWLAERLSHYHQIEVLTTCAKDYILWKNHYPPGMEEINGVIVRRFKVKRERNIRRFSEIQADVFDLPHTTNEELEWVRQNGPYCPKLVKFIRKHKDDYDWFLFYSYRYYTTFFSALEIPYKSILVPTAEEDPAIKLSIFKSFFESVRAFIFLTPEEKDLLASKANIENKPYQIIGSGINIGEPGDFEEFKKKFDIHLPYILYIGRIDKNKGCDQLFEYFLRYVQNVDDKLLLLLIGPSALEIPQHPSIKHLGQLDDRDKYTALSGCEVFVLSSFYESLSIALLEAWAFAKPALVNGRCKVLKGQSLRSNASLFYENYQEFRECLKILLARPDIRKALGEAGRRYIQKEYNWQVIEKKVNDLFNSL